MTGPASGPDGVSDIAELALPELHGGPALDIYLEAEMLTVSVRMFLDTDVSGALPAGVSDESARRIWARFGRSVETAFPEGLASRLREAVRAAVSDELKRATQRAVETRFQAAVRAEARTHPEAWPSAS